MPQPSSHREEPAPLGVRVTRAEIKVLTHRRQIAARVSTIGKKLRTQLASPAMLVAAGGLGFAAGIYTKPKPRSAKPDRRAKQGRRNEPGSPQKRKPFAILLGLLSVIRSLEQIVPSSAIAPKEPGAATPSAAHTIRNP